jgi:DNA-binding XRE family transcriptional regulator
MPGRSGPVPLSKNGKLPGKRPRPQLGRFARWLKVQRVKATYQGKPITQRDLANLLGMPYSRIVKLEEDVYVPRIEWIDDFARFFKYDADKLYLMAWELPPDMHYFLTCTKQGEKMVENIRKIMNKLPEAEPTIDATGQKNYEEKGRHRVFARYDYFSRMDDRVREDALQRKNESRVDPVAPERGKLLD